MKLCIHCGKNPCLSTGGRVYCRLCALAYRKSRDALVGLPWWQWPAYDPIPWTKYLTAVVASLEDDGGISELTLACSRPTVSVHLPPAAIRVVQQDILRSS